MSATPNGRMLRENRTPRQVYTPEFPVSKPQQRPSARYNFNSPATPGTPVANSSPVVVPAAQHQEAEEEGPMPLTAHTPANNPPLFPNLFYQRPRQPMENLAMQTKGPELLNRIRMSFKSGLASEQEWAVDALLNLSFHTPSALNLKVLGDVTNYLFDVVSNASFLLNQPSEATLKMGVLAQSDEEYDETQNVMHAMLILRNAAMQPTNAHYLAQREDCKLIVERGLGLPRVSIYSEFKGYCIEMAEAISFHVTPESPTDGFFVSVVQTLSGNEDRGMIVPSLRALARLVVNDKRGLMESIPDSMVEQVIHYLLVDDEELISASLDFLYQYTASKKNVGNLFSTPMGLNLCTRHLVRLLTYRISEPPVDYIRLPRRTKKVAPKEPPTLSEDLVDELLQLDEPARATQWIRCSYEEDANAEVTQISLWKAYESQFSELVKQGKGKAPVMPGVHFINNVTPAFKRSAAMVVNLPSGQKCYIIKGIKPREYAVTPDQLNAPPPPPPVAENRQPSTFGVTACLVLQNIAMSKEGSENLQHTTPDLMKAMLLNSTIQVHVQELLDLLPGNKP